MWTVSSTRWTRPALRSSLALQPTLFQHGLRGCILTFSLLLLEAPLSMAAERVIVALVDHVKGHPSVIGYQLNNETKPYDTSGPNVQAAFVQWMRARHPDLAVLNKEFGLDYWSNRINRWEDLPSVNGSINASLSSAFAEFQRGLVTDYFAWQASLVRRHARPDQFLTHNFDLDWRGYFYGIQPEVNHFAAARALDIAGIDIYHPTQDHLTGTEIAFGGDLARSIRGNVRERNHAFRECSLSERTL